MSIKTENLNIKCQVSLPLFFGTFILSKNARIMKLISLSFALHSLRRDWRSAELRILVLALIVAVTAVSAVSFFTNRIERVIEQQATELLAADLRISSAEPLPPKFINEAFGNHLDIAKIKLFQSVLLNNTEPLLISVKAVDKNYPLRGHLRVAEELYGVDTKTTTIPTPGTLWLEERLLNQLNLQVGESLNLGEMRFNIAKVLTYEPDRGGRFFQIAPRVLMNLADVEKTQLLTAGSRVRYRLLVAGSLENISTYRSWLETQIEPGQIIQGIEEARPELRQALKRAEQFLGLAALVAVILAGVAVAVAAQYFSQKQADASAIMRCLGATQQMILQIYLFRLSILSLLASSIGCLLGWLAQAGLANLLTHYLLKVTLPSPSWLPVLLGFATGFITLLGFALPPVLRIHKVPPLRVLRHELGATPPRVWQLLAVASVAMALLMFWQAGDTQLALIMIGGTFLTLLLLMGIASALIHSLQFFRHQAGVTWRFGIANLARRAKTSSVQLTAFGLGIMALLLLAIVRVDLLDTWQGNLPEGTPNYFIINIQSDRLDEFQAKLSQYRHSGLYPMSVGRFIAINGQPVLVQNYTNDRAKNFVRRTFNLSSVITLPEDNQIVAGRFWSEKMRTHAKNENSSETKDKITSSTKIIPAPLAHLREFSVEERFAKEMGIQLGDTLQFRIGGQDVSGKVTSLRTVQWDSFQVNFFVLASPAIMQDLPKTYVTSFYLSAEQRKTQVLSALVREFPSITPINVEVLLAQVRQIMDRATLAVQYVFLFTLLAGIMVLYAAISASHDERLYEGAILRTLGATRRQVLLGLVAEFATLGILAGFLAASMASGLGYVLAEHIFELPYHFNGWIWIIGVFGGALGIGLAGFLGTYSLLERPPLETLRRL
jgi:putative ABC transport system permease protein